MRMKAAIWQEVEFESFGEALSSYVCIPRSSSRWIWVLAIAVATLNLAVASLPDQLHLLPDGSSAPRIKGTLLGLMTA